MSPAPDKSDVYADHHAVCSYSVQTVVEDIEGAAYDLSIYNYPTTFDATLQDSDRLFPQDAVLLIREPVFMPSQQGSNPLVRVDSPSDIVVLAQHSAMLPEVSFATAAKTDPPARSRTQALMTTGGQTGTSCSSRRTGSLRQ